MGTPIMTN